MSAHDNGRRAAAGGKWKQAMAAAAQAMMRQAMAKASAAKKKVAEVFSADEKHPGGRREMRGRLTMKLYSNGGNPIRLGRLAGPNISARQYRKVKLAARRTVKCKGFQLFVIGDDIVAGRDLRETYLWHNKAVAAEAPAHRLAAGFRLSAKDISRMPAEIGGRKATLQEHLYAELEFEHNEPFILTQVGALTK